MNRVLIYEIRRQVINRFFVGLLAVCLLFAWLTLRTSVIRGVANTAPFSAWSFGYYMAQVLPLLVIALLFSLWTVFSPTVRNVAVLTRATPADERKYYLLKCCAALASWFIILLGTILLGLVFLIAIFGNVFVAEETILSCVVVTLPTLLFFFGVGLLAGRLKKWQSIVVISLAVIVSFLPITEYSALFGTNFFSQYPLTLDVLDPAFSLPLSMTINKVIYSATGVLLVVIFVKKKNL